MTNETILILKLSIFPTLVAINQLCLHMGYTFRKLFGIQDHAATTQTF